MRSARLPDSSLMILCRNDLKVVRRKCGLDARHLQGLDAKRCDV